MGMNMNGYVNTIENGISILNFADSKKFKGLNIYDEFGIRLGQNLRMILNKALNISFLSGRFTIEPQEVGPALNNLKRYITTYISSNNKADVAVLLELIEFFTICDQNGFYIAAG